MGWVAIAGLAVSALAQKGAADNRARDDQNAALEKTDQAQQEADLIRRAARAQRASAQAAFVGSGVDTSTGTPIRINDQINQDSELDAYNALLSGRRQSRALNQQARETRAQGNIDAASTVLSGAGGYARGGWKLT